MYDPRDRNSTQAASSESERFWQEYMEELNTVSRKPPVISSAPRLDNEETSAELPDASTRYPEPIAESNFAPDEPAWRQELMNSEESIPDIESASISAPQDLLARSDDPLPKNTPHLRSADSPPAGNNSSTIHLITSTLLSLAMVIVLLLMARWLVPSLVESTRYAWYRGQLRAEYETTGEQLKKVSFDSLAEASQMVSRRIGPSVVHVNLLRSTPDRQLAKVFLESGLDKDHPALRYEGQGSGFVIDSQGYILTNHHVIEGDGEIEVTLSDGRLLPAEVIGVDPPTDLAVIRVDANDLLPVEWGDSEKVVVGTPVWAAGSPFGLQQTVTFGIVSGKHRIDLRGTRYESGMPGVSAYGDLMQSDVALNRGNSGGPLVNALGEVVGVNAAILGETYHGVSFSIPSKVARRVAAHLMIGADVPRGWLGIKMDDLAFEDRFDGQGVAHPGVRVMGFPSEEVSPAREAGIKVNDLIIEFNGKPVMNRLELMRIIGETEVGTTCTVSILREGERKDFNLQLAKRQANL